MRNLLDLEGRWVFPAVRRRFLGQTGSQPVALDDALTVFRGQGPIIVPVLANDTDPDGGTLTVVSATAALGSAMVNGDGTVTYTAPQGTPPGVVEFDTVTYEIADPDDNRDTGQVDVTITEPVLSVDVTPGNTLTVTAPPDPITITVTDPASFAGTYTVDPLDLFDGPMALSPPVVDGTEQAGETLTARDGLWVYDLAAEPVTQSWQWRRAGVDIPGATARTYVMQAGDEGQGVAVLETLTDAYGARTAASAAVSLAFQPSEDPDVIDWWDADDASTLTSSSGAVSNWASRLGGTPLAQITPSAQPRSDTRLLNGRTVLDFADSDFLVCALSLPANGDFAIHMVAEIDVITNAFAGLISFEATRDFQIDAASDTQFDGRLNVAGIGTSATLTGGPYTGPVILSAVFDFSGSATAEVFIGDQSRAVVALTDTVDTSGALHLMTNRARNAGVAGAVGELVVTSNVTNRSDYQSYLSGKWGLI